jgi:hypothetical protein
MPKQLVFDQEARSGLKAGMDVLARAVMTTLGPKGRNVAIDKKFGAPTITHDGVSVAKEIELKDPYENMGAQLLKEAATKTKFGGKKVGITSFHNFSKWNRRAAMSVCFIFGRFNWITL